MYRCNTNLLIFTRITLENHSMSIIIINTYDLTNRTYLLGIIIYRVYVTIIWNYCVTLWTYDFSSLYLFSFECANSFC